MTYTLSLNAILDTMYALAALHQLSTDRPEPLLDPDRSGAVRLLIKNAFATVCLSLIPHVIDCRWPGDNDDDPTPAIDNSDLLLSITLATSPRLPDSMHSIVRRNIEQAIAHHALSQAIMATGDTTAAQTTHGIAVGHLDAVSSALDLDILPYIP